MLAGIDESGEISEEVEENVMAELRTQFRPEFLKRLDEIIMFKPLTKENIKRIAALLLQDVNKRLADREISIELSDKAMMYVAENGYDPVYGARPLKRFLQKNVETLTARIILGGQIKALDAVQIYVEGDELKAKIK